MGWLTRFQFLAGAMKGFFLFATTSRPTLGNTQPCPIQLIRGAHSLGVKWLVHESDHSFTSSAEVKNAWSLLKQEMHLHGMVLS